MAAIGKPTFHIAQPTGVCRATGRPLAVGEVYIATLVETDGSDELEREDYSLEAWNAGARPGAAGDGGGSGGAGGGGGGRRLFASWRACMAAPNAPRRVLADDDSLLDLFEQLASETDPRKVAFRFVLALLLIRRKVLVLEGSERGLLLVRERGVEKPPKGPPLIEVTDPDLDEEAIAAVIEQMKAITGDEPAAPSPPPSPSPPSPQPGGNG